jgi:hypothetical protein
MTLVVNGLCGICGSRQPVRPALVAWRVPVFGQYEAIDRCDDEDACRARVRAAGDPWPVIDPRSEEERHGNG